ncbi:hypothetical protein [Isoptericola sp. NPDC057191]|uniref:hypothetical protein n=1 Tax=Isoptericola sp. NPDC057191 TaxID=3346041 RepID=UPI00362F664D
MDTTFDTLPPQVLVGLVTLTVVVLLRLRPRPARTRRLLTGPVVVMVVGAFLLVPWLALPSAGGVGATVVVATVDLVLTVGLGVARAATVQLSPGEAGVVQYRYTGATVALWAVSVAVRFELAGAGARLGASPAVTEGSVLLALGLALLTQNVVVARRAARVRSASVDVAPRAVASRSSGSAAA